jgi:hypothetical protein
MYFLNKRASDLVLGFLDSQYSVFPPGYAVSSTIDIPSDFPFASRGHGHYCRAYRFLSLEGINERLDEAIGIWIKGIV